MPHSDAPQQPAELRQAVEEAARRVVPGGPASQFGNFRQEISDFERRAEEERVKMLGGIETDQLHRRIERDFTFHAVTDAAQARRYEVIRHRAKELAHFILDTCPAGRERSLAITKLEEVVFWTNAGIAREGF